MSQRDGLDLTFTTGVVIAGTGILGGLLFEHGNLQDLVHVTAGLIVICGTTGAVVISSPRSLLISAVKRSASAIWGPSLNTGVLMNEILDCAAARLTNNEALEQRLLTIHHTFLQKAMKLIIDGYPIDEVQYLLEKENYACTQRAEEDARLFEVAGGYAPTIGIIGAVLGLMQVMKHLSKIQDVGHGIATAFVATLYGVSLANLLLLPLGAKIRTQARLEAKCREMIIEATSAMYHRKTPRFVREVLRPFVEDDAHPPQYRANRS